MRVLLLQPQWIQIYGKYSEAAKVGCVSPPLGLCYLASSLTNNGHKTIIIDMHADEVDDALLIDKIREIQPDLIGITSTTPIFDEAKKIAGLIKKNFDIPIVMGGVHLTILPQDSMQECESFDYGIVGEGEKTIVELVSALEGKGDMESIHGLIHRKDGQIVMNCRRSLEDNLDSISPPALELLNLNKYVHPIPNKGLVRYTSIFTSRGCPFDCIFCSQHTMFGKKVRYRGVENVLAELEKIVNELNIHHIIFMDETLTLNKPRLKEICAGIIKRGLRFTWEGWTRANTVDEEILMLMKEAGLVRLSFGIESGNPEILKRIKKGVVLEEIQQAYNLAKRIGIETRGSVMIGHPYETRKTIMDTFRFIKGIKECDQVFINITTPYPGTELYQMAINGEGGMKLLSKDFSKYKRYGDPVIEVGDMTGKDLIMLQKQGLWMFYLTPKRIWYNVVKRTGVRVGMKNVIAFARSVLKK